MDNETREKLRPVLYLAAGAYLVYLAFKMYGTLGQSVGTEHTVSMAAMVIFGIFGAVTFVFGIFVARKVFFGKKETEITEPDTDEEKEEN